MLNNQMTQGTLIICTFNFCDVKGFLILNLFTNKTSHSKCTEFSTFLPFLKDQINKKSSSNATLSSPPPWVLPCSYCVVTSEWVNVRVNVCLLSKDSWLCSYQWKQKLTYLSIYPTITKTEPEEPMLKENFQFHLYTAYLSQIYPYPNISIILTWDFVLNNTNLLPHIIS